jgi:Mn2+/Fe2+ NRAMP family transporter
MSPEAGARFEYKLVWLIIVVHLLKYQAFECAPRYVAAERKSLLDAYAKAPGPRNWAIWMGLVDMSLQALGLVAALIGLTASFLTAALGGKLQLWALAIAFGLLAMLRWGRYATLRGLNLILMLALAGGTLLAFIGAPPSAKAMLQVFKPQIPAGSLLLVTAILGFMPTSVAVSIWQSLWALEQGRFRPGSPDSPAERRERLRQGLLDLRLGYGLSAVLAILFVSLGATLLHPRGLVPEGPEVAMTLSRLYTLAIGEWMQPVFLLMAFFALLTTCSTMMDGFPRSFVAALRVLRGQPSAGGGEGRTYWFFLLTVTFGGMALLASLPDPALLVKGVGAFGLLLSPVYFALNLWAVTRCVDDPALRPGRFAIGISILGILFLALTAILLLWTTFGSLAE